MDLFDDFVSPASSADSSPLLTAATPSRQAAAGNHSAEQTSAAGAAAESSASSQQVRHHFTQRLQRLLGKRSTIIGFHDQPISDGQSASRQSQALLVASQHQQHDAANHWTTIAASSSLIGAKQRAQPPPPPLAAAANSSFYSLLAAGQHQQAAPPPQSLSPPVRLEPGTRNLVLVRPVDKESAEGEQSLLINVRCSPRRAPPAAATAARSETTTIPVRIIVTDANDHAPEFLGPQPFVVNISETTPLGTVVLRDIEATDRDSAGPFSTIHYRVLEEPSAAAAAAPYSSWLQFVNPLVPNLMVARQLDYETQPSFQLTIVAQDEGEPEPLWSSAQVQVNIIGKCGCHLLSNRRSSGASLSLAFERANPPHAEWPFMRGGTLNRWSPLSV